MWHSLTPKGKIPYVPKWNLWCKISPVITVGDDVLDADRLGEFGSDLHGFEEFKISILYDNQVLYSGTFDQHQPIVVDVDLLDDKENTDHVLCIGLEGKTDDHSCFHQGKSVSLAAKINLSIEQMPLDLHVMATGIKTIAGENGVQNFSISTPIYRWLLKNHEHITADLYSIYKE